MEALNLHFYDAGVFLGHDPPKRNLIWDGDQWWLPPEEQIITPEFQDTTPKHVVEAYRSSSNLNSTLSFLVPVSAVLSGIPAGLAFYHSSGAAGTASDSDFWQLVASSANQILSAVTLILPTIFNIRLAKMAWFWTWIFAGVTVCCSVVAPPLYLIVPTKWSAIVSFAGSLAQTFITLQLMFSI